MCIRDSGGGALASSELYDPATAGWTAGAALGSSRKNHTATLLTDGRVWFAGGSSGAAAQDSSEIYDIGLGYQSAWQPQLISPPSSLLLGGSFSLTGTRFRGISGGSSGSTQDAPANIPSIQLFNIESGRTVMLTATVWTDASLNSSPLLGLPAGAAILTVTVNGISSACITQVSKTPASVSLSSLSQAADGSAKSVSATTNPAGLSVTLTYNGSPTQPSAVGSYAVVATITDSSYSGSVGAILVISAPTPFTSGAAMNSGRRYHTATLLNNGKILVCGGQYASILNSAELYDPATGSWTYTGQMTTARIHHSATLLPNGKVLVVGGQSATALATAEIYDPALGTWSTTGSMSVPRVYHTATLLASGNVLVTGGQTTGSAYLFSTEIYDPSTGSWAKKKDMTAIRLNHAACMLANGKVLVCGGQSATAALATAELYDPASDTWAVTTGPLVTARVNHTATRLANGTVLVAGGYTSITSPLASAELFDPATGKFTATGDMKNGRYFHTASLLPNGRVICTGGSKWVTNLAAQASADVYNPVTGTWASVYPSLIGKRYDHTATLLANGKLVVAGGYNDSTPVLASTELYDNALGTWASTAAPGTVRTHHSASLLPDGRVLAIGGWDGSATQASVDIYNPATGVWASATAMVTARRDHTATLLKTGNVLVVGGHNTSALASAELYNPTVGTWLPVTNMTTPRFLHTATLLADGRVLVAGGKNDSGALTSAEIYNPLTGLWSATGSLLGPRDAHSATLLSTGKVLVTAGENGAGVLATAELFDPTTGLWSATGGLSAARLGHTTTLLPSGKVLVAGGSNGTTYQNSTQLYNPATGTWAVTSNVATTATTTLTLARASHTAGLLTNGKVLVAGGTSAGGVTETAELFDPATGLWQSTGALNSKRESHTATTLANGRVLVIGGGGSTGPLNSAESYDVGLGFAAASQPIITTAPASLVPGSSLALAGSQFRGLSAASGGNGTQNSSSDLPVVQLRALDSGLTSILQPASWTDSAFSTTLPTNFPQGCALVTVCVNGIPSASAILKIAAPDPLPYSIWKLSKFTTAELADPAISGDSADPDQDGIPNLMEYALALDPLSADANRLPSTSQQAGYLTMTYRLNKQATDVLVIIEVSADLTANSWFPVAVETGRVDMGSYWQVTVRDSIPTSNALQRFMRLQVKTP